MFENPVDVTRHSIAVGGLECSVDDVGRVISDSINILRPPLRPRLRSAERTSPCIESWSRNSYIFRIEFTRRPLDSAIEE